MEATKKRTAGLKMMMRTILMNYQLRLLKKANKRDLDLQSRLKPLGSGIKKKILKLRSFLNPMKLKIKLRLD
jgi:hypothetical protein